MVEGRGSRKRVPIVRGGEQVKVQMYIRVGDITLDTTNQYVLCNYVSKWTQSYYIIV